MKYFYIVIQVKENNKYYAYTLKVSETDNLLSKLTIKNIISANICQTKKQAREIIEYWNNNFIKENKFMFDVNLYKWGEQ